MDSVSCSIFLIINRPRRLTDRSLPPGLSSISPDANLFDDLMEMEKRLDWTMTRRRQEITDTLNRGTLLVRLAKLLL